MNTIGFCNSLNDLLKSYGLKIVDGDVNDVRIVGTLAILVMILICALGMDWEAKAQNFLIAVILIAMFDFMLGTIIGPLNDDQVSKGFIGFNCKSLLDDLATKGNIELRLFSAEVFSANWASDYRTQGVAYDFFQVFAIFFPSVTGIQAGANISGDLRVSVANTIDNHIFLR